MRNLFQIQRFKTKGIEMARPAKGEFNKSGWLREYLTKNPEAEKEAIHAAFKANAKAKGKQLTDQEISNTKSKIKSGNGSPRGRKKATVQVSGNLIAEAALWSMKNGGLAKAKAAIEKVKADSGSTMRFIESVGGIEAAETLLGQLEAEVAIK